MEHATVWPFFNEAQIAVPTEVVQHELQCFAFAWRQRLEVQIKYLACAVRQRLGVQVRCSSSRRVERFYESSHFQWDESFPFGLHPRLDPFRFKSDVGESSNGRRGCLQIGFLVQQVV